MKKSTLVLIIAGLLAFMWYRSQKGKSGSSGKEVSATYIGEYMQFATDQYVNSGDWVSGILNSDGSLTMEFYDETGTHTLTFPADTITEIQDYKLEY